MIANTNQPDNKLVNNSPHFVLASQSLRRQKIINDLKINFQIYNPQVDESLISGETAANTVKRLAKIKAENCAQNIKPQFQTLILSADTLVVIDDEILGKPANYNQALSHLKKLSGKTHEVMTGFCLMEWPDKIIVCDDDISKVTMKFLSDDAIDKYIKTGEPMDKAGAYAVQGLGFKLVKNVEGSLSNVIGLPVEKLKPWFIKYHLLNS